MENQNSKPYNLEARSFQFAKQVRSFVKLLPKTLANTEDTRQLIRASGSVGANYIEANDSLSKKDFIMRIKICRKEAKECRYWLGLLDIGETPKISTEQSRLSQEATELMNIFGAILHKSES